MPFLCINRIDSLQKLFPRLLSAVSLSCMAFGAKKRCIFIGWKIKIARKINCRKIIVLNLCISVLARKGLTIITDNSLPAGLELNSGYRSNQGFNWYTLFAANRRSRYMLERQWTTECTTDYTAGMLVMLGNTHYAPPTTDCMIIGPSLHLLGIYLPALKGTLGPKEPGSLVSTWHSTASI